MRMRVQGPPARGVREPQPEFFEWQPSQRDQQQAVMNHGGQTLDRLNERGGVSWCELAAILRGERWQRRDHEGARALCVAEIARRIAEAERETADLRKPASRESQAQDRPEGPARSMRLRCFGCGKPVSSEVPGETVVRAILHCPECYAEESRRLREVLGDRLDELCIGFGTEPIRELPSMTPPLPREGPAPNAEGTGWAYWTRQGMAGAVIHVGGEAPAPPLPAAELLQLLCGICRKPLSLGATAEQIQHGAVHTARCAEHPAAGGERDRTVFCRPFQGAGSELCSAAEQWPARALAAWTEAERAEAASAAGPLSSDKEDSVK